jgi:hypothetical protein
MLVVLEEEEGAGRWVACWLLFVLCFFSVLCVFGEGFRGTLGKERREREGGMEYVCSMYE